ncbi:MAG: hypothetical protein JWP63_5345, partial [Candidatus Solibacter sp.]|nr:hypothetical protein [Candidatus Solibacter sp.]
MQGCQPQRLASESTAFAAKWCGFSVHKFTRKRTHVQAQDFVCLWYRVSIVYLCPT